MNERDDRGELAAASASHVSQLPAGYRHDFECLVLQTLIKVFGAEPDAAARRVEELFRPGNYRPNPMEELFLFHDSPLHIAADLAGQRRVPTANEQEFYAELATRFPSLSTDTGHEDSSVRRAAPSGAAFG